MNAARGVLRWVAAGLLVLFLIVWLPFGAVLWRAWDALPRTEGEIALAGLDAPVRILRDERGVPHIFAETDHDAAFAVGVVHAQDRLWQMHVTRWYLRGRIAEVLGGLAAQSDRQMRAYGIADAADALAASLDEAERARLQAYSDGVNALMEARGFAPPLEFLMLAVAPEPWTPADSLLMYKGMAFDLSSGDAFRAYGRTLLAGVLSPEQTAQFLAPYPENGVTTFTAEEMGLSAAAPADQGAPAPPAEGGPDTAPRDGSNAWVVSGAHTESGLPLLANDPHLGQRAPGVWYLAAVHTPDGAVVGATLPGAPEVVIGHNGAIGWGMTITGTDVADLAFAPESAVVEDREETVRVRFGGEQTVRVRRTAEGPVLSPELFAQGGLPPDGMLAVLRWPLDDPDDRTAAAAGAIRRARDWDGFRASLAGFTAPMVNIAFASADGDIGMASPGFVPVRGAGGAWTGRVPPAELPAVRNPADGVIVNANNRLVPDEYPHFLTADWAPPWRARRATDLLAAQPAHTVESFAAIQTDRTDLSARALLPALLRASPQTERGRQALDMMAGWDGDMAPDSPRPLIYAGWMKAMARAVYADELGDQYQNFQGDRTVFMQNVLTGADSAWCDDTGTDARETCADIAGPALDAAVEALSAQYGADIESWRWGAAHPAYFPHAPFSAFPVLDRIFSARIERGGSGATLNEAGYSYYQDEYVSTHGPSLRVIYDFADLDASRFAMPMGQSGHLASPHYRDLLEPWARGDYFTIPTDLSPDAPPAGTRVLTLEPAP